MRVHSSDLPRILIAEYDQSIAELFNIFLRGEGYEVSLVPSVERALERLDEQTFHVILTDLFIEDPARPFARIRRLLQHSLPTPVGLITGWQISPGEARRRGFAFLLQKPFDLDLMLTEIAACLALPLTPEQERQKQVAQRFIDALQTNSLETTGDVFTEDVTYFSTLRGRGAAAKRIQGRAAVLAYFQGFYRFFHGIATFDDLTFYPRPKGWAMRYRAGMTAQDGSAQQMTGAFLFHFQGEQIYQISIYLNDRRLLALVDQGRR